MPQQPDIVLESIDFKTEEEAYACAISASECARRLGFAEQACLEIKTAVSEIAINAVRYAGDTTMEICSVNDGKVISVRIRDSGHGIDNISQALEHGFTTLHKSLGVGFSVADHNIDELIVESSKGRGTTVILKKFLPVSYDKAHYGIVSIPDQRYRQNGDAYVIKEYDGDKVLLAVIDGMGQGEEAEYIATFAKKKIEESFRLPLPEIIAECAKAIRAENINSGVALALAVATGDAVHFAAIGDTHSKLFGHEKDTYILSQSGLVGKTPLPKIRVKTIPVTGPYTIIMCSDGINDDFSCGNIPHSNAQQTAEFIFNKYQNSHGDATVLVAKIREL